MKDSYDEFCKATASSVKTLNLPENIFDIFLKECIKHYDQPSHAFEDMKTIRSKTRKAKGDIFELFCQRYLKRIKGYDHVWLLTELTSDLKMELKLPLDNKDYGIDLIALKRMNCQSTYSAIQCKFKSPKTLTRVKNSGVQPTSYPLVGWKEICTFNELCNASGPFEKRITMTTGSSVKRLGGIKNDQDHSICINEFKELTTKQWIQLMNPIKSIEQIKFELKQTYSSSSNPIKPRICPYCLIALTNKDSLNWHQFCHEKDKQDQIATLVNKMNDIKDRLDRLIISQSSTSSTLTSDNKKMSTQVSIETYYDPINGQYKCPYCLQVIVHKSSLKRHISQYCKVKNKHDEITQIKDGIVKEINSQDIIELQNDFNNMKIRLDNLVTFQPFRVNNLGLIGTDTNEGLIDSVSTQKILPMPIHFIKGCALSTLAGDCRLLDTKHSTIAYENNSKIKHVYADEPQKQIIKNNRQIMAITQVGSVQGSYFTAIESIYY